MPRTHKKFWQTQKFKEIQKEWEDKLKDSGFVDAENNNQLTQNSANSYRTKNQVKIETKLRYYELLGQGHNEEKDYRDWVESYIMERRAWGISQRQISRELKDFKQRCGKETIRKIVRHFERKWKIKTE